MTDKSRLSDLLSKYGQEHLLTFWDKLDEGQRAELAADIGRIDFALFARVWPAFGKTEDAFDPETFETPNAFPASPSVDFEATYTRARELGEQSLRGNRVAAMTVAGGQATRLGIDAPKGVFAIAPISGKSLFQLFAESIRAVNDRFGGTVPWYIMTSSANHNDTRSYFEEHSYFGLKPESVRFFQQGMMPVTDEAGKILLAEQHRVALSPNGHGGSLTALAETGMLQDLADRGVDYVSYFQVDNPLVLPVDPLFVGLHALERSEMSSLTVGKASDDEKVGLFVTVDGTLRVVEYTAISPEVARLRASDGTRKFDQANIAIHMFDRSFIERILRGGAGFSLPFHGAKKAVACVDLKTGRKLRPRKPNALKAEMFVFDALPLAQKPMLLYTERRERFSPVKNAEGVDSIATAKRDMVRRAAAWLERCGVGVPRRPDGEPDCEIEISPGYALDAGSLSQKQVAGMRIEREARFLLE